ncbi:MAG: hypothetical protein KDE33_03390 [Bacteroidetes bacterium]|nr:hypothetical protein [Bacteroidota bacterium]
MTTQLTTEKEERTANMGLAKWRVTCIYDTFVVKQTVVHLMNFCAEIPPLRQAQKRCAAYKN